MASTSTSTTATATATDRSVLQDASPPPRKTFPLFGHPMTILEIAKAIDDKNLLFELRKEKNNKVASANDKFVDLKVKRADVKESVVFVIGDPMEPTKAPVVQWRPKASKEYPASGSWSMPVRIVDPAEIEAWEKLNTFLAKSWPEISKDLFKKGNIEVPKFPFSVSDSPDCLGEGSLNLKVRKDFENLKYLLIHPSTAPGTPPTWEEPHPEVFGSDHIDRGLPVFVQASAVLHFKNPKAFMPIMVNTVATTPQCLRAKSMESNTTALRFGNLLYEKSTAEPTEALPALGEDDLCGDNQDGAHDAFFDTVPGEKRPEPSGKLAALQSSLRPVAPPSDTTVATAVSATGSDGAEITERATKRLRPSTGAGHA